MSGRSNPGSLGAYAKGDPGGMEGGGSLAARKHCPRLGVGHEDEGDGLPWPLDSQQETAAPLAKPGAAETGSWELWVGADSQGRLYWGEAEDEPGRGHTARETARGDRA